MRKPFAMDVLIDSVERVLVTGGKKPVKPAGKLKRFCDRVAERAAARGLTEDKLTEILGDER